MRYLNYNRISLPLGTSKQFGDAEDISDWAYDAVLYMSRVGIINGDDAGYARPQQNAKRADGATMLYNLYTKVTQ